MTTDRKLLELAAKAANIKLDWYESTTKHGNACALTQQNQEWNPLEKDGDALRLAAELRLLIKPGKHLGDGCTVESQRTGIAGCTTFYDDKNKQMRRAIVIVAAEIGKRMEDERNE